MTRKEKIARLAELGYKLIYDTPTYVQVKKWSTYYKAYLTLGAKSINALYKKYHG